jgi:hypothetical protein
MTTETEIQEIARRLGWNALFLDDGYLCEVNMLCGKKYEDPETNADLHMRWMVEHGISVVLKNDRSGWWYAATGSYMTGSYSTPHEAIRAALLAKLRSEQDG